MPLLLERIQPCAGGMNIKHEQHGNSYPCVSYETQPSADESNSVSSKAKFIDVHDDVQTEIVQRLSGGAQSGRAAAAEKALEKIKEEGSMVEKPFVARKRSFA